MRSALRELAKGGGGDGDEPPGADGDGGEG